MAEQVKKFFKQPKKSMILKSTHPRSAGDDLVNIIRKIEEGQSIIIERGIIPDSGKFSTPRKFLKHGPELKLKRFSSLKEYLEINTAKRPTPVQLRDKAFLEMGDHSFCGISFIPITGNDKRKRKISLVESLAGAWIFAYEHQINNGIEIRAYQESRRVEFEGAIITVRVPSRTKGKRRYEFTLDSVPVVDSQYKIAIAHSIRSSGHDCKRKEYGFRFRYSGDKENSDVFNFCAHEIAAYLEVINYFLNERKNIIPLQMSQFPIPTTLAVDFFKRLCDSTLIRDNQSRYKDKLRKLNQAEKEILLWDLVYKEGPDATFFATEKVEKYDWSLRHNEH